MTIEETIQSYQEALNQSDTDGIIACYSEDPVFMPSYAPAQIGRRQVQTAYSHVFNKLKLNVTFTIHETEIMGDMAYVRTTSEGTTTILEDDLTLDEGNNELFIFKQEDNSWKIHRFIFTTNQPRG